VKTREETGEETRAHEDRLSKPTRTGQFLGVPTRFLGRTPWDTKVARRTALLLGLVFALAVLVTAASDEGGVAWSVRAARTLPVLPVAGAVSAYLTLAPLRRRGDVRALSALGQAPWRIVRPAVIACAALHLLVAALVIAWPRVEVSAFFPRAPTSELVVPRGDRFVDARRGITINADGTLEEDPKAKVPPAVDAGVPRGGRTAIAMLLLLAGIALPLASAVTRRAELGRLAFSAFGASAVTIFALHLAAAGTVHPLVAVVPWGLLLTAAALRYRSLRWT
jgi:hypothetical protein